MTWIVSVREELGRRVRFRSIGDPGTFEEVMATFQGISKSLGIPIKGGLIEVDGDDLNEYAVYSIERA